MRLVSLISIKWELAQIKILLRCSHSDSLPSPKRERFVPFAHIHHKSPKRTRAGRLVVRDLPPLAKGGGGRVANENLGRAETLAEGLEPLRWNEASKDSGTGTLGSSGVPACASYPVACSQTSCSNEGVHVGRGT